MEPAGTDISASWLATWRVRLSASAGRKRCVWIGAEFRRSSAAIATRREGRLPRSVRRMLKQRPSLLLATYEILGFRGIKPGASLRLNPARHRLASCHPILAPNSWALQRTLLYSPF